MQSKESWLLEPRGVAGILAATWRVYVSWSGTALVIGAVMLLPAAIVQAFTGYVAAELGVLKMAEAMKAGTGTVANFDFRPMILVGAYQVVSYIILFVSSFLATAAIARIAAERAVGQTPGAAWGFDWVLREVWRLSLGSLAYTLVWFGVLIVGAIAAALASAPIAIAMGAKAASGSNQIIVQVVSGAAMLIPMSIFAAYLAPAPAVAGIERRGGFASVGRSFGLVSGNFGRAFLVTLAAMAIVGIPSVGLGLGLQQLALKPIQAALGEANGALVAGIPQSLAMVLLSPFASALSVILYLNLRLRKTEEGFTVTELAYDLGYEPVGAPPSSPFGSAPSAESDPDGSS